MSIYHGCVSLISKLQVCQKHKCHSTSTHGSDHSYAIIAMSDLEINLKQTNKQTKFNKIEMLGKGNDINIVRNILFKLMTNRFI